MANQTQQLACLLEQGGAQVEIVQANMPYRPDWVGSLRGARAVFRLLPFMLRLWKVSGRVQLFHVMANSGWAWHLFAAPAIVIAKIHRVPVVVNYRGGDAEAFLARSHWVKPVLRLADRLVVPSGFLKDVFARFGVSAEIVPNVVDLRRFAPRSAGTSRRADEPHLIVTRNLEPIYDVGTALRAFAILRQTCDRARITIAGTGPEAEALRNLTRQLGVQGHVTFTGTVNNERISELYRGADIFLNVSLVDNMPISILEAFASRVPVVSTGVGGIAYLIEDGKTGLLVPPRDPEATARALLDLINDPARAERIASAAHESVQQYAWQNVCGRLYEIYAALAPHVLHTTPAANHK